MIRSLYIAKTGLDAQQTQLDVISNNLANVSTSGFKRSRAVFEDMLYQTVREPGAQSTQQTTLPSGLQIGTGVAHRRDDPHPHAGQPVADRQLARPRDPGRGLLPDPAAGRHDRLHARRLVPSRRAGPDRHVERHAAAAGDHDPRERAVGHDRHRTASVTTTTQGSAASTTVGTIQLATFINPAGLSSQGQNLYIETASSGTPQTGTAGTNGLGLINQGYVETSNVNVAEELVNMIQTQRAYELNSKAITTSDQMLQRLTQM